MAETPQGSDLSAASVTKLPGGVEIDKRMRVGGAVWLQKHTGKTIMQIANAFEDQHWDMLDLQAILVALYVQRHPGIDEDSEDFKEAVHAIDSLEFGELSPLMSDVFSFEPKNSPSPEVDLTEAPAVES